MKNNTMVQEDRETIWCANCKNDNTPICKECVFAGVPTKYKTNKPVISKEVK